MAWRAPLLLSVVAILGSCSNETTSRPALVVDDPFVAVMQVVVVRGENTLFGDEEYPATIGASPVTLVRLDEQLLGFVVPPLDPGVAELAVAGFPSITLTVSAAPEVTDPVGLMADHVAATRAALATLRTEVGDDARMGLVLDAAERRLSESEQAFAAATAAEQLAAAVFIAANPDLFDLVATQQFEPACQRQIERALWYGVRIAIITCTALLLAPESFAVSLIIGGYLIADLVPPFVRAVIALLHECHIIESVDTFAADAAGAGRLRGLTPLPFVENQASGVSVTGEFRLLGPEDSSSEHDLVRRVIDVVETARRAWDKLNGEFGPAPDYGPTDPLRQPVDPARLSVSPISRAGVSLKSATPSGDSLALTFGYDGCPGAGTVDFDFTLTYRTLFDTTITVPVAAHLECGGNCGELGQPCCGGLTCATPAAGAAQALYCDPTGTCSMCGWSDDRAPCCPVGILDPDGCGGATMGTAPVQCLLPCVDNTCPTGAGGRGDETLGFCGPCGFSGMGGPGRCCADGSCLNGQVCQADGVCRDPV